MAISDYEINPSDILKLWDTEILSLDFVNSIKLFIKKNNPNTDLVGNPLSLTIISEKLYNIIAYYIENDVQTFDIKLINSNNTISGYKLIHPIKSFKCVNFDISDVIYSNDNEISCIPKLVINKDKVKDSIHIFRLDEVKTDIIFSDFLAKLLIGKSINGVAFIRCKAV
jgi:hypothetical protein